MSITIHTISKTFGSFQALSKVSLEVPSGGLTALLGPSGSGKTTLLRIVAGLESADASPDGQILFDGVPVTDDPVNRRGIGFVFQHYALFRHMSVFENVAFGLRVKRRRERPTKEAIRDKVHALLKLVQLDYLADRYPHQLSGGQRQRVALARALAVEPKVLLLDEPFGALDAKVRAELRRWLRDLHDRLHITSVFVTHDQEEALEVADRIVVMNEGRIEQEGTPDEVFHRPATEFVLTFLGDVNVFHGRMGDGVADFSRTHPGGVDDGTPGARLMVRPHQLDIIRHRDGRPALAATVRRVLTAGPLVKIELADDLQRLVQVHVPHELFLLAPVAPHEAVFVVPRHAQVYADQGAWVGDYVI